MHMPMLLLLNKGSSTSPRITLIKNLPYKRLPILVLDWTVPCDENDHLQPE